MLKILSFIFLFITFSTLKILERLILNRIMQLELHNGVDLTWSQKYGTSAVGDETRSGYMQYVQGILPNIPACTTFIDIYELKDHSFSSNMYLGMCTYHGVIYYI